jgi:hypothetical protein
VQFDSRDNEWTVSSPGTRITLNGPAVAGRHVVAPAIEADVSGSNERVSAVVDFSTPEGGLSGRAGLSHDLAAATGTFTLQSAALEFDLLNLSAIFTDWPYDWDVTAGRGTAGAEFGWSMADSDFAYKGSMARVQRIDGADCRLPRRPLCRYRLPGFQQPAGYRS